MLVIRSLDRRVRDVRGFGPVRRALVEALSAREDDHR